MRAPCAQCVCSSVVLVVGKSEELVYSRTLEYVCSSSTFKKIVLHPV